MTHAASTPTPDFVTEEFTPDEQTILRHYFTNIEGPVFALVNLPEVVKGALFARYSRTHKSLRRLFLDEFVGDLDITGDSTIDATVGLDRAEELYRKVFVEYGDDSVAQLGGVHLACEQVSNVMSKVIEWGRLMAYLEQSTRYLNYAKRFDGRYRYLRPPEIMRSNWATRYVSDMDAIFDSYARLLDDLKPYFIEQFPQADGDSDIVHRQAINAKVYDSLRGLLPAATLTNLGIYGNGQTFEYLAMRLRAHPLPEARSYAELMLAELRKVIPSFMKRVDIEDRGGVWTQYLADRHDSMAHVTQELLPPASAPLCEPQPAQIRLVDFDPDGENKLLAAALFSHSDASEEAIRSTVEKMSADDKLALARAYIGERLNRRHRPGRAFELPGYRFEVLCDYGAFRDLQRHRMLTMDWQPLGCTHGYVMPDDVEAAGFAPAYHQTAERSAELHQSLSGEFEACEASYAVLFAYRVRFYMHLNAREAMHVAELRSMSSGHEVYRRLAQDMCRLIREVAGHSLISDAMRFVGKEHDRGLERLESERKLAAKRQQA